MQDEVKVTQADRDAAASCVSNRKSKREIIDGVWDESSTVQAFARHRHQAERETPARMEPVAMIRFDRGTPGNENEMPKVISCIWMPDGEYTLYALPPAPEAKP